MKTQDGSLHVLSTSGNGHTLYRKISHVQGKVWPSFPPQSDDWLVTKKVAYLSAFNYNSASKISNLSYLQHFQTTLTTSSSGYVSKWLEPTCQFEKKHEQNIEPFPYPLFCLLGEGKGKDSLRPMLSPRSSCYHPRSSAHLLHRQEFQNAPLHLLKAIVVLAHWEATQGRET